LKLSHFVTPTTQPYCPSSAALAVAIALALAGPNSIQAASANAVSRSAQGANNLPASEIGYLSVFGYAKGALSSNFSIRIEGKTTAAKEGAVALKLATGVHVLEVLRDGEFAFELPVFFDQAKRMLLLTLDRPGSVDYVLQDAAGEGETSPQVLDAGRKILPGMEARLVGKVVLEGNPDNAAGDSPSLANVLLRLEGTDMYALTDATGQFEMRDVPAGDYTLQIQSPNFAVVEPIAFSLAPKESAERSVSLALAIDTLAEIKVMAAGVSQQTASNEEERASASVAEVLNAEQMKRGGDSEASGALKRVTGLSVVGGKFIYVRGMGERYSSVLLNGAQIPSPDPTRRVVPLDLFPTEVLDSVVVQKSYSADMPAEFGGGTVQLRTKEAVQTPFFKIGLGSNVQMGTTFKEGLRYRGGNRDWLGFDRVRALPAAVSALSVGSQPISAQTSTPAQLEAAGEALAGLGFNTRREKLGPDANFSVAGGKGWQFNEVKFSLLGAVRQATRWDTHDERRRSYGASDSSNSVLVSDIARAVTERSGALTGFVNGVVSNGAGQRLQATSMVLRQSLDQTQIDQGYKESPDDVTRSTELEWNENSLIFNQLGGEHYFANAHDLGLTWQIADGRAARKNPAKRRYIYQRIAGEYFLSRGSDGNQIVYENLADASREYRVGFTLPWTVNDSVGVTFSGGVGHLEKDRTSDLRRFTLSARSSAVTAPAIGRLSPDEIFSPNNIGANGYQLAEITRSLDNYLAAQSLDALFLNADWVFGEQWRVNAGLRHERNDQKVSTFDIATPTTGRVEGGVAANSWLPALAGTYIFDDAQQQLRLSYGRSVSRPDFREYSPAPFLDPILDIESFGNPRLQPSKIDNLDFRWERYFDGDENISAALFYKRFDKPIERVSVAGTGGLLSYENAASARNVGVELEGFMQLERFAPILQNYFIAANFALIKSTVDLGRAGLIQTSRNRPLQGQSNYLTNLQVGYKPAQSAWQATLLYNVAGRRISQVGAIGLADIFEEPFHQLDITSKYTVAPSWSINLRLKNILNQTVDFTQGGASTRRYKPGREFGFSIEWTPSIK
jgi:outer membrane receptor protein involved in Fe transport